MGLVNIVQAPAILAAQNPVHAIMFMVQNGWVAFAAMGAVVLAFTGAEALYADMFALQKTLVIMLMLNERS